MKLKSSPRKGSGPEAERDERKAPRKSHARKAAGPSQRMLRVAEEIRHVLADLFLRTEFHDHQLAGQKLTVSEVRMSPDLKHAAVFITRLGNKDVTALLPALKRVSPFLRGQIAPRLGLRVTPDLKFLQDEALEQATKINKLLHAPEVQRDLTKQVEVQGTSREERADEQTRRSSGPTAPDPQ